MQRLYKRRKFTDDGRYRSNWDIFGYVSAIDYSHWLMYGGGLSSSGPSRPSRPNNSKLIDECEAYWKELDGSDAENKP